MNFRRFSTVAAGVAAVGLVAAVIPGSATAATTAKPELHAAKAAPDIRSMAKSDVVSTPLTLSTYADMVVDSAAGHVFVSGGSGSTGIAVTDLSGNPVSLIQGEGGATGLLLSPDGSTLYAALNTDNAIAVIDAKTLKETARYSVAAGGPAWLAQESAGKIWFSYGSQWSGGLGSVDLSTTKVTAFPSPAGPGYDAPLLLTGSTVAPGVLVTGESGEEPSTVVEYDVSTGTPTAKLHSDAWGADPCTFVRSLIISPDGKDVIVSCPEATKAYKLADYTVDRSYGTGAGQLSLGPDGMIGLTSGSAAQIYQPSSSALVRQYSTGDTSSLGKLAWSADGTALYSVSTYWDGTGSNNVTLRIWSGSNFVPYGPMRLLDTRDGTGGTTGTVAPGATVRLQIGGVGSIPSDVTAAALNITGVGTSGFGYITAYPDGMTRPGTSNVNWVAGAAKANTSLIPVAANGYVDFYNSGPGSVDIVADITGYFVPDLAAGNGYTAINPARILDTRNGTGAAAAKIPAGGTITLHVAGAAGGAIPAGITAVALNLTATDAARFGYITAYPSGGNMPTTSTLNYGGENIANAAIVPVGADGTIKLYNSTVGAVDLIADATGYFSAPGVDLYEPLSSPVRIFDSRTPADGASPLPAGYYEELTFKDKSIAAFAFNTTVTDTRSLGYLSVYPAGQTPPNASNLNWLWGETVPNLALVAEDHASGGVDFYNGSPNGSIDLVVDLFGFFAA